MIGPVHCVQCGAAMPPAEQDGWTCVPCAAPFQPAHMRAPCTDANCACQSLRARRAKKADPATPPLEWARMVLADHDVLTDGFPVEELLDVLAGAKELMGNTEPGWCVTEPACGNCRACNLTRAIEEAERSIQHDRERR